MSKTLLIVGAAIVAIAVPAIAMHSHGGGDNMPMMMPDMTRAQMEAKVKEMFAEADANKDGALTMDEAKAQMAERHTDRVEEHFKAMDSNKDGSISHDEFVAGHKAMDGKMAMGDHGDMPPPPPMPPAVNGAAPPPPPPPPMRMHGDMDMKMGMKMGEHLFEKADANNDGKVTLAEALKAANARFDAMDANKDGTVTAGERMDYMKAKMRDWKSARATDNSKP